MPIGRPLKFKTEEELQKKIEDYFNNTPKDEWTITGLALALDTSRKVLCEYEGKEDFSNAIKRAKLIVENGYEIDLKKHGRAGTIFALKNFDWRDRQETDITSGNKPLPIISLTNVQPNNSNNQDNENVPEDKGNPGWYIRKQNNLNPPLPDSIVPIGQNTETDEHSVGELSTPKEGGGEGLSEHTPNT